MNRPLAAEFPTRSISNESVEPPFSTGVCELFSKVILIREVEERLLELFSQGKLFGTVHTCIGQEWTGVAIS